MSAHAAGESREDLYGNWETASAAVEIPHEQWSRLFDIMAGLGVSPALGLSTLAGVVVERYAGSGMVEIGASALHPKSTVRAWQDSASEDALPLVAVDVSGNPTLAQALERTAHRAASEGWAEAVTPLDSLRLLLQSEAQVHSLLKPRGPAAGSGQQSRPEILLCVVRRDERLEIVCRSRGDCDAASLLRIAKAFQRVVLAASTRPTSHLAEVDLLDPADYHQVVVAWNQSDCDAPNAAVHEIFAEQAATTPHAPALIYQGNAMSYGELDRRANRLANLLRTHSMPAEPLVGVCLERSPDAIVAIFAALKAGGAYVPLDPGYPPARLHEMVSDCRPAVIVTRERYRALLPESGARIVCVDGMAAEIEAASDVAPQVTVTPESALYVLYTSGSSGKPKPVIGTHRSATNRLCDPAFDRDDPDEICCLTSSLSFGFSVSRLFVPLLCGRPLVLLPDGDDWDILALADFWAEEGVSNVALVTPVCRQLLASGPRVTSKLTRLRTVVVGGAMVTPDLMALVAELLPQATLLVIYAASELGCAILKKELRPGTVEAPYASVGRPFANTRVFLLDSALQPVPVGVVGEVYIAASHLSRGYLNQPGHTAERFVANPFGRRAGERVYRTGDIGRHLANGEVELLGRADDMVKIRGYRIELQEVEAALTRHPDVQAAAVTTQELSGEARLVAYVVAEAGSPVRSSELRKYLRQRLPEYMLPSRIAMLEELPLTAAGKLDKGRLPPLGPERPDIGSSYERPRDQLEIELAAMWESLLEMTGIGVHDDFMELGGDSVMAAMIMTRLCVRYGLDLSAAVLLQRPTIAELSVFLRAELGVRPF